MCRLIVNIRVYCNEHWYGVRCSVNCQRRDDAGGHYRCDKETGRKICLPGKLLSLDTSLLY